MNPPSEKVSWSAPSLTELDPGKGGQPSEFERVWLGFMTARATLGLVLVLLQGTIFALAPRQSSTALLTCVAYFCAAMAVRVMTQPQQLGNTFDIQWLRTVGVDVLTFAALQIMQSSAINYAPLFALPVLMASILGTMLLAMGAAAGVTLFLFAYATWLSILNPTDASTFFLQAALTGSGCFAISFIASQLATRLATVELRAQRSHLAATVQRQINELVIESLADGILVVDEHGLVRSANPAAHLLLGRRRSVPDSALNLTEHAGYQPLLTVISTSFSTQVPQQADVSIRPDSQGLRHLKIRTQLTTPMANDSLSLCVVFMQDQRELQARVRAEKLSSMGRMSAAVAHEIRNPLAAITQANALLAEDLTHPAQQQLARMVQQNAQRLEKIVSDVLHLAHAPTEGHVDSAHMLDLTEAITRICRDWSSQRSLKNELLLALPAQAIEVWFDPEHLRRIVINLLDNALRYASGQADGIQVSADASRSGAPSFEASLRIWSDGAPLEPSVEQHLFEPFFSSESRSSGLGLYICRELCESHGAAISYERTARTMSKLVLQGNEFSVLFRTQAANGPTQPAPIAN